MTDPDRCLDCGQRVVGGALCDACREWRIFEEEQEGVWKMYALRDDE